MNDTTSDQQLAQQLVARHSSMVGAVVTSVEPITGDASSRRYVRVNTSHPKRLRLVMMILAHGAGPLVAGEQSNQDDTFVELSAFLRRHDILTPEVYVDGRDLGALLVEDIGDSALWRCAFERPRDDTQTFQRYKQAIDCMLRLRSIEPDQSCISFRRWLDYNQYLAEASRFIEFFVPQLSLGSSEIEIIRGLIENLSRRLADQPRVLSHRDFMSWNLHLDSAGNIRVLDFQDALLAAPLYDLISLITDRDTAAALGDDLVRRLLEHAREKLAIPKERFTEWLYTAMLQRHLRLCGQFLVLSEKKGNPIYKSWIPGMLHWIGRALRALPEYGECAALLQKHIPEVNAGYRNPI